MFRPLFAAVAVLGLAGPLAADEARQWLGYGRLVNNDALTTADDRWQTFSYASSRVWGPAWQGDLPNAPFDLLEFRIGAQIAAPANLRQPAPGDRPFAGALSFGLHTHYEQAGVEVAAGLDLVFTGPQTLLGEAQTLAHDTYGIAPARPSVLDDQVGNGLHPSLVVEVGRSYAFGPAHLRPFAEARAGFETLARVGADLSFGAVGQGDMMVRDPVTGQRYRAVSGGGTGFGVVLGGDFATVGDSVILPGEDGFDPEPRTRLRAGLHWQGDRRAVFYGVTWLSEEFDAQPEPQLIGSLRLKLWF